jgi:hypothetical protein
VRRHRAAVALVSLAVLLISGSGIAAGVLSWRLNQRRIELSKTVMERDTALQTVTAQRDAAQMENRAASSANHFLAALMMNLADESPQMKQQLLEVFRRKAAEMDSSPVRMRPEIESRLRITLSRSLRALGDYATCEDQSRRVIALCDKHDLAQSDREQAMGLIRAIRMEQGKFDEVLAELRSFRPAIGPDGTYPPHELLTSDQEYVEALFKSGQTREAQAYLTSMLPPQGFQPRPGPHHRRILRSGLRRTWSESATLDGRSTSQPCGSVSLQAFLVRTGPNPGRLDRGLTRHQHASRERRSPDASRRSVCRIRALGLGLIAHVFSTPHSTSRRTR